MVGVVQRTFSAVISDDYSDRRARTRNGEAPCNVYIHFPIVFGNKAYIMSGTWNRIDDIRARQLEQYKGLQCMFWLEPTNNTRLPEIADSTLTDGRHPAWLLLNSTQQVPSPALPSHGTTVASPRQSPKLRSTGAADSYSAILGTRNGSTLTR